MTTEKRISRSDIIIKWINKTRELRVKYGSGEVIISEDTFKKLAEEGTQLEVSLD